MKVTTRIWPWRFVLVAAVLLLSLLFFKYPFGQHSFPSKDDGATTLEDAIFEAGIFLPSSRGPFICPVHKLPEQVRMRTNKQNVVVLGHGSADLISDALWEDGKWEFKQLSYMETYMHAIRSMDVKRDGYLDLGANIGTHTLNMATRGFRVHAFEPTPNNNILLECSLALNRFDDRVRLNKFGLGDRVGQVCMKSMPENWGDSRAEPDTSCPPESLSWLGTMNNYYVRVLRGKNKIAVMKIDIQGSEIGALRLATDLFDSEEGPVVVFFEYDIALNKNSGHDAPELLKFFHNYDFDIYRIEDQTAISSADFERFGTEVGAPLAENLIALKRSWKAKLEAAGYLFEGGRLLDRVEPGDIKNKVQSTAHSA
ncbi:hypothetical protein K461DRAFT_315138 [Myriangium duriaei CBS 260.36]|uniref:Methyltransferase FkbM domain-containing protein n=1 Tax=Myriangium duriaei CBS 260.36 TaxID=1168546 RepID=A0A9P4IYP9_9PEZI|nr:hypothetical protein K461DRAFT_315138 [Myriangium duriaei CBS 260.36]